MQIPTLETWIAKQKMDQLKEKIKEYEMSKPTPTLEDWEKEGKRIHDIIIELEKYTDIEGAEIAETCLLLISLCQGYRSYISNELRKQLIIELENYLEMFQTKFKIVETEWQPPTQKCKELEQL